MKRSKMFLIYDDSDHDMSFSSEWYRGSLLKNDQKTDEYYDIFFVDHGKSKKIHISNIFRLESLSIALSKYPQQAIRVRLYNIPPITKGIAGRMRALLPSDTLALVSIILNF